MTVQCLSGKTLHIPAGDPVFVPTKKCNDGELIDPATFEFELKYADSFVKPGVQLVLDDKVETVVIRC